MKMCFTCETEKPLDEFCKDNRASDGLASRCKLCNSKRTKEWRDRTSKWKDSIKKYKQSDIGKAVRRKVTTRFREEFPEKHQAHLALQREIRSGRMIRPDQCSSCDETKHIHGHHEDYTKPLTVIWLCAQCHADLHNVS